MGQQYVLPVDPSDSLPSPLEEGVGGERSSHAPFNSFATSANLVRIAPIPSVPIHANLWLSRPSNSSSAKPISLPTRHAASQAQSTPHTPQASCAVRP